MGLIHPLQIWGGIECTVNRVGDAFFDQLEYSGHARRLRDLDVTAELGLKTLRYPVLWERTEGPTGELDFAWSDQRLMRLQELGIDPIVGLLHHGSGPARTSLLDPEFPQKLASYAACVAERYPFVTRFTPVNEPLTTARFSGLYGHWYPHARDDRSFVRALLNQCKGTILAMAAIRRHIPDAQLIQTEDLGFTRSTETLGYQADFENERRWLSFDLLCGRMSSRHPLYNYLRRSGATPSELGFFEQHPCAPDVLGLNYYITSERFLDDRLQHYPAREIGGNGRRRYVDVEAVRVCAEGIVGPGRLLLQAEHRYGLPLAITEAHLGSSVDQQQSWFAYVWQSALGARELGADIRAVTVWALLGAYGWDRLVTQGRGNYEPGAFSVAGGAVHLTPYYHWLRELVRGKPRAVVPGWWTLPDRLLYEPYMPRGQVVPARPSSSVEPGQAAVAVG